MAERNVPDAINAGVMGNSQGNREGVGETDITTQRRERKGFQGDEQRETSDDRATHKRQSQSDNQNSPDSEATFTKDQLEKGEKRNTM